jgi:hypothetical protein
MSDYWKFKSIKKNTDSGWSQEHMICTLCYFIADSQENILMGLESSAV